MLRVLFILACLMVIAGALAMVNGASMILNERGWSQLISGSVVMTGGLVVGALAGVLFEVKKMLAVPLDAGPIADVHKSFDPLKSHHMLDSSHALDVGVSTSRDTLSAVQTDAVFNVHSEKMQGPSSPQQSNFATDARVENLIPPHASDYEQIKPVEASATGFDKVNFTPEPLSPAAIAAPRPQLKQPSLFELVQEQAEIQSPVPMPAPHPAVAVREQSAPPPIVQERILLASYSTGGVGYYMYSDQSIEAEMAIGRYRFQSMDELRRFIETQVGGEKVSS
jgi:hypothetical protein